MYILYITLTDRRVKRHVPINMKILYPHKKKYFILSENKQKGRKGTSIVLHCVNVVVILPFNHFWLHKLSNTNGQNLPYFFV